MAQRRKAGGTGEERRADDFDEVVLGAAKQEPPDQQRHTSETDSRPELGETVGSGWVVTLALALFLYSLLLALDYPVGRWAQSVGGLGGWAALFPPAADEWSWRLPEPLIRVPVGGSAEPRVESAFLSPPEGSAPLTLAGSRPVKALGPEERAAAERAAAARGEAFNPTDDAMATDLPVVMRSLLSAADWPALSRWTPDHIARHMPTIRPHISARPAIRMHTAAAPMGRLEGVQWPRPWEERELPTAEFLRGEHPRAYLFLHDEQLPRALREDLGKRPRCCRHLGCILQRVPAVFVACPRRAGAAQRALPQARGAQRLVRLRGRHHPDPLRRSAQHLPPDRRAEARHPLPRRQPRRSLRLPAAAPCKPSRLMLGPRAGCLLALGSSLGLVGTASSRR